MLSEPRETLERRIRIMTMPFPKKPWIRALILGSVGAVLVAIACWAPGPLGLDEVAAPQTFQDNPVAELPPPPQEAAATDLSADPTFTPFTVRPDIKNRQDLSSALEREYPPLLMDDGIGGTVLVWFFIDETGTVRRTHINQTSGHQALDEAALRVAEVIQFTPALNRDERVPVWISLPIRFQPPQLPAIRIPPPPGAPQEEVRPQATADPADGPSFTPFTVRPDIRNRSELQQALEREYPPLLRDAGIGGTVQVWIYIDETGTVGRTLVNVSSGHPALDEAALRVADIIEFTPALNRDVPVPVWISLPVAFTIR